MTSVPNLIFWQAILTAPSFWFLRHVARHILICQSSPLGRMEKKKERQRWTFVNVKGTRQERTKGPFLAILSHTSMSLHSSHPNEALRPLLCSPSVSAKVGYHTFPRVRPSSYDCRSARGTFAAVPWCGRQLDSHFTSPCLNSQHGMQKRCIMSNCYCHRGAHFSYRHGTSQYWYYKTRSLIPDLRIMKCSAVMLFLQQEMWWCSSHRKPRSASVVSLAGHASRYRQS